MIAPLPVPIGSTSRFPIWKLLMDPRSEQFCWQSRTPDGTATQAAAGRLPQADTQGLSLPEDQWLQLQELEQGIAIWQGQADPELPLPLGLYAYELGSASLAWQRPDLRLDRIGPDIVIAIDPERPNHRLWLDLANGELREQIHRNDQPQDFLQAFDEARHRHWHFPQHGQAPPITGEIPRERHTPVDYLLVGEWQIVHSYTGFPQQWQRHLTLVHLSSGDQQHWPLGKATGWQLDPFFVAGKWLCWIENEHRFCRWQVPGIT